MDKNLILQEAGLNWEVGQHDIQTVGGIVIPDKMALIRDDNNAVLGVHGKGYEPYQNHELLELLHQIGSSTGLELHSGGQFKGGQKVWFQLKSNDLSLNGDRIEGFISGINSFDGSTSLAFGNASTTISCENSFWRGYKELSTRMRHSGQMRTKIDEILSKVDVMVQEEKDMFKHIVRMADVQLSPEVKELVTKKLFGLTVEDRLDDEELSTRKKNSIITFNGDLQRELAQKGDNLWGMFSGITRYTTHSMKKDSNSEAKMFGAAGRVERQIFNDLVEMI